VCSSPLAILALARTRVPYVELATPITNYGVRPGADISHLQARLTHSSPLAMASYLETYYSPAAHSNKEKIGL
jgi:hypothetical protein